MPCLGVNEAVTNEIFHNLYFVVIVRYKMLNVNWAFFPFLALKWLRTFFSAFFTLFKDWPKLVSFMYLLNHAFGFLFAFLGEKLIYFDLEIAFNLKIYRWVLLTKFLSVSPPYFENLKKKPLRKYFIWKDLDTSMINSIRNISFPAQSVKSW